MAGSMTTYIPSLTLPRVVFEKPAIAILLPIILGSGVGYAVSPAMTRSTYRRLAQPPGNPPSWVFGPVWTLLYGSMGYASYSAWTAGHSTFSDPARTALAQHGATLYTLQLAMNLIWTPLFFGLEKPVLATVDIVGLTGLVGYLTYTWSQVDERAGYCLVPYLGWLSFATYLCAGCGYLNNWDFKDKEIKTR